MTAPYAVGDRVTSKYGLEHTGSVVKVDAFADGTPMLHVRRDTDGFVWIGWPDTVRPHDHQPATEGAS